MENMRWNYCRNSSCTFSDIYNSSDDHNTTGNATINIHGAFLNFYNYFHQQLTVTDKAREIFTKPTGVISFIVCCLGLFGNITSIMAITKLSPIKSMHLKVIISLCLSDSFISFSILFDDVLYIFTAWDSCTRLCTRLLLDLALLATLFNLLAMALDHFIAIFKPIHYRQLMTKFQMNCIIAGLWTVSVSAIILEVFVGLVLQADSKRKSLCEAIQAGPDHLEIFIIGFISVVLLGIIIIYTWVYSRLSMVKLDREVSRCPTDSGSFKALFTSLLFIGTFVVFWVPDGTYQIVLYIMSKNEKEYVTQHIERFTLVNDVLFLILQLNSVADPVIYAFRLPKVRSGFADICSLCRRKEAGKNESSVLVKSVTRTRYSSTFTSKERKWETTIHEEVNDDQNNVPITHV